MANENEKTGPGISNSSQAASGVRDLKQALKDVVREGEDFNDIIKDQVKELNKLINGYDKVRKSIDGYRSTALDVKKIQQDLEKSKANEFVQSAKIRQTEEELAKTGARQLKQADEYLKNIAERSKYVGKDLEAYDELLAYELKMLSPLGQELIARKTALDFIQATTTDLDKQLTKEKEIQSAIGLTGTAFGKLSEKLGLGASIYEAMVKKARDLQDANKDLSRYSILGAGAKEAFKQIDLRDPLVQLAAIGGIVKGFTTLVELALSVQDRTTKFGRALGLSYDSALKVRNEFTKIAYQSDNVLVTTEKLMQSQEELTGILGTNNILSGQILATNIKLKDIAGLDADTRAEIAQSSIITAKSSEDITKSILAQVVGLEAATGISLNYQRILKEASSLGGYLGLSFAKYPDKLTKSLVTVKAMGLELKQLDGMADSFLDFESSISKEFEAQLLTGKNINLSRARELFLTNDLAGAAQEISSQVGSAGDFLKLNRIQAESLASAFGMSRDQLGDMLKKQEVLSKLGASDTDNAQKQLELGLKRFGTQKALAAAVGDEAYQSLMNLSAQEKLTGFMDKIKQSIADFIANSPLVPLVEKAINWLSKPENIQRVVGFIQNAFALIFDIVGKVAGSIMKISNFFGAGISQDLIDTVWAGGDNIRALNLAAPVTSVGKNRAIGEAQAGANNNITMSSGTQRERGGNTYISVSVDPITGNKVVKTISSTPGAKTDYSLIANPE